MGRTRLAVVFGGRSSEHSISCISAGSLMAAVDRTKYDVVAIGITPDGHWVLAPDDPTVLVARGSELPSISDKTGTSVALPGDPGVRDLIVLDPREATRSLAGVDVVFPLLHGPYGEDGTIQGLLELAGIPYVGSGVLASALCMDKAYMKLVLEASGLPVGPSVVLAPGEWDRDAAGVTERVAALGWPAYVKPARGGSSIGISKVIAPESLGAAVAAAAEHDPKVIVTADVGREIECAVIGGANGGPPEASLPAEIKVSGEFYDFTAKYLDEGTTFDIPADLPPEVMNQVRDLACQAFTACGCEGLARVDFFVEGARILVNEVNTMPGFTPMSMYPRMWAASGVDYPTLVDRLVALAIEAGTGLR